MKTQAMTKMPRKMMCNRIDFRRCKAATPVGLIVAVVLLVCLLGGAATFAAIRFGGLGASGDAGSDDPEWAKVTQQNIKVNVVAEGELVAKQQVDVRSIIEHREDPTIESVIEEGTWVEAGDWLCTLTAPGVEADYEELESRVRQQEATVVEAERNLQIERDSAQSEEDKARLALELATLDFNRWELGTVPQRQRELDLALKKAVRELEQAQREVVFSQELFDQGHLSQSELETDEIRLLEADDALISAQQAIAIYEDYEYVKEEKEQQSSIEQAEADLAQTISRNENQLVLQEARVDNERTQLEQVKTRLERSQRYMDALVLTAPTDGLVIYGSTVATHGWERRNPIRQGATIWGGRRVVLLTDTSQMIANLRVHEAYVSQVEIGQHVDIDVTARPNEPMTATVIEKKNSANADGSGNPNISEYLVLAEMPPSEDEGLRPGMRCRASIQIRTITNALAVPIQAVQTQGEVHFVFVPASGGKIERRIVEIGGASDTLVELTSGLEEGERVLIRRPKPGEITGPPIEDEGDGDSADAV